MNAGELAVGMPVRYPNTGTVGKIIRIEEFDGCVFAQIDKTELFYRADQLIPAGASQGKETKKAEKTLEQVEKDREYMTAGFQEALSHTDQSCEGGG